MNGTLKKRSSFIIILAMLAFVAAVIAVSPAFRRAAAEEAAVSADIKANYDLGETLVLPENAAIEVGGATYAAKNGYLVYPSGKAVGGKSYELSETGRYTLVLEAEIQGKMRSAEKTFTVNQNLYRVSDAESYVEYGEINSYFAKGGMSKGLGIHLTDGATFTYSAPINVYENKITDVMRFNLMRRDNKVEYLTVRLTDCYDPSIAVEVIYWKVSMEEYVILTAGQKGYSALGLNEAKTDSGETGKYVIDGKQYNVGVFGTEVEGNRDRADNKNVNNITLTFDTTDRQAIKVYESTDTEPHTKLVTQLNNDKLYSYKFPGFTDGNVFLSITASGFKSVKYADIEIGELMGSRNEELNKIGKYTDKDAPVITVAANEKDNKIYVGAEVKVPAARAIDASGIARDVDYTVWYNYSGTPKHAVAVKDGKFIPEKSGEYTVVYTAADIYGNEAEKLLTLDTVGRKTEGISVSVEELTEICAGETVNLLNYRVNSLCSSYDVIATLVYPDNSETVINDNSFTIEKVGRYTVRYEYSDVYYDGSYEYSFVAKSSGKPVFGASVIPAPAYFIKGANYSVGKVSAFVYTENGKTPTEIKTYLSADGGEYAEFDADDFTVKATETARIRYVCEADDEVFLESNLIKVVDVGYGTKNFAVAGYFVGDFTGESDLTKTTYIATVGGEAKLDFINSALSSAFAADFNIDGTNKITETEISFTDFYNPEKSVSVKFLNENGAKVCSVNGEKTALNASWLGSRTKISAVENGLRIGDDVIKFDFGFKTDLCNVTFKFKGVEQGFKFELYSFCNQTFKKSAKDVIEPMISVAEPDKIMSIGETYSTRIPCVADVLSPSPLKNVTLSVYLNGKPLTDKKRTVYKNLSANQTYAVEFSAYGTYLFVYEYADGAGNFVDVKADVQVIDDVPPTIEFKQSVGGAVKVKVNEKVKPLEITASDNETSESELSVWAIVYDAHGRLVTYVKKSNDSQTDRYSFSLNEKGRYTVYIYCADATGNTAYLSYEIEAA